MFGMGDRLWMVFVWILALCMFARDVASLFIDVPPDRTDHGFLYIAVAGLLWREFERNQANKSIKRRASDRRENV